MLLDHLDLDRPGLEKVRAAKADPARASAELLAYYRTRTSVKHPVDRAKLAELRGQPLDKGTKEIADDALRNVLIACSAYPRFDFGRDIDWLTNRAPNGDNEWLWQLNRHSSWWALGAAWRHTGEEKYAECYVRQLLDWIGKCPRDADSPAWRTIEAGIRGHGWTVNFQHFVDAPAYTPEALIRHLESFRAHAGYLTGRKMSTSNWGLMEAEGAAFIAMTFPEFREAPAWRQKAFAHLNAMMKKQVRADGHQYEQCLGYHLGCIDWFARTGRMAAANGLEAMCEVLLKVGLPDGSNAQFGDDHSSFGWRGRLSEYAALFKRDDLLFAASAGKQGRAPAETAFALKESGFYSMRSGWDPQAVMLLLKCGPDGGWHCQPDNGSFEVFAGGRHLTPDSGSYIYHGDEQAVRDRAWFRQTRVHQTLTLDGRDAAYAPKLLLWKPGADLDTLVVENGSYPDLVHRRAVFFVQKRFFVIVDEALGKAQGNAWLHFQLAPGEAVIDERSLSARTGFPEGTNLLVQAMAQEGLSLVKEEGQVSFEYGKKQPRPAFRFELAKGQKPLRFVTVLVPHEGPAPAVRASLVGRPEPGADALELDVEVDDAKTRVGYELKTEGKKE
jgi:heparan-sulfate lyase